MTHIYIDEECTGFIKDYQGNVVSYNEKSSIYLEEADYSLSLSWTYLNYILGLRERKN